MQLTAEAHQLVSDAIRRTLLNPNAREGDREEYNAQVERLGGTLDGDEVDTFPEGGSIVMAITNQWVNGGRTSNPTAAEQGLTADELTTYSLRQVLDLNELPLLAQIASAYGLQMDIVFTEAS